MAPFDMLLYAGVVFGWSTSWLPLKWQLGVVAPEISLFWRFLMAAPMMALLAVMSGQSLRFDWRVHWRFAALGLFIFSGNFTLFYHAANGGAVRAFGGSFFNGFISQCSYGGSAWTSASTNTAPACCLCWDQRGCAVILA